MVEWWWGVAAAAVPVAAAQQLWRRNRNSSLASPSPSPSSPSSSSSSSSPSDQKTSMSIDDNSNNNVFFCERVCTSKRMLNKVGAFAKDPNPSNTCVTVCGASQLDACSDACARSVCSNQHHIPNWNDVCLRRCQNQCLHLQSSGT